jgi:hypothetical protein
MSLRQSTSERVFVVLLDPITGNRAAGITAADHNMSRCQLTKSDGTTSFVALVDGTTWIEVDGTESPGLYQLVLSTVDTNTLGQVAWTCRPAAAAFLVVSGSDTVTSVLADIASVKGAQNLSISDIAGGIVWGAGDNLHNIAAGLPGVTNIANAVWNEARSGHTVNGTYGEFARTLYLIFTGHAKIDRPSHTLTIYAEDGLTPYKVFNLKDIQGAPADILAAERIPI